MVNNGLIPRLIKPLGNFIKYYETPIKFYETPNNSKQAIDLASIKTSRSMKWGRAQRLAMAGLARLAGRGL